MTIQQDAEQYLKSFGMATGLYFPESLYPKAFNLVIQFGQIAVEVQKKETFKEHPHAAIIDKIGDVSLSIAVDLINKIPRSELAKLEVQRRKSLLGRDGKASRTDRLKLSAEKKPSAKNKSHLVLDALEIFLDRPLRYADLARVLYFEEYGLKGKGTTSYLANKAGMLINGSKTIRIGLKERGMILHRLQKPDTKAVYLLCTRSRRRFDHQDLDLRLRPAEDELVEAGLALGGQRPIIRPESKTYTPSPVDDDRQLEDRTQPGIDISWALLEAQRNQEREDIRKKSEEEIAMWREGEVAEALTTKREFSRQGMYVDWIVEALVALSGRTVAFKDLAKVLYWEDYELLSSVVRNTRVNETFRGASGKIERELANRGFKLLEARTDSGQIRLLIVPTDSDRDHTAMSETDRPNDAELERIATVQRHNEFLLKQQKQKIEQNRKEEKSLARKALANNSPPARIAEFLYRNIDQQYTLAELVEVAFPNSGESSAVLKQKISKILNDGSVHRRIKEKGAALNKEIFRQPYESWDTVALRCIDENATEAYPTNDSPHEDDKTLLDHVAVQAEGSRATTSLLENPDIFVEDSKEALRLTEKESRLSQKLLAGELLTDNRITFNQTQTTVLRALSVGLSLEEIAEKTHISSGKIEAMLQAAQERLSQIEATDGVDNTGGEIGVQKLEKHLAKGMLILKSLSAGISVEEVTGVAGVSATEVERISRESKIAYRALARR
ncbi:TPA: hypothetical protein DIS56_01335 [Candidatus Saccharibacteria bacterium]|nr:MAG: hypothetical protein UX30_C0003G0058 [Candidatus Saccharibacteria bacterium GW2011_GWA2_46_10]OGL34358.1 MAG: hypothetical protein A3F05_02295 [Candidatus Saccharibacteria bacterium RIFCSPHIGHO2_12_FULL_47_17]HCM51757.1 hypothetical protein [Candidatus Saccharibacteria bacterium]